MINIRKGLVVELAKHKLEVPWNRIFQNYFFQMDTRKRTTFFEYIFVFKALRYSWWNLSSRFMTYVELGSFWQVLTCLIIWPWKLLAGSINRIYITTAILLYDYITLLPPINNAYLVLFGTYFALVHIVESIQEKNCQKRNLFNSLNKFLFVKITFWSLFNT